MKVILRTIFVTILLLALIYGGLHIIVAFQGKALVKKRLYGLTQKKVTLSYLDLTPPFNLEIKNLNIEGLANIESVFLSPSIPNFLFGNIAFNKVVIIRPEFTYKRMPSDPTAILGTPAATAAAQPTAVLAPAAVSEGGKPFRLILKRLNIKDGKINFIDKTVGEQGLKVTIKEINFNLTNLYLYPLSAIANFDLKGKIPWQEGREEGKIEAEGWLNLFKKDVQATLKIKDIDGVYLYPYYSHWVDLEKARIEKANLNFTSNITGLNNNVAAECHLELTDIVRKPRPADEPQEKAEKIADAVLEIFKALDQGNIVLDFNIKTKMDRPEFGFDNIKMAFESKLAQARGGGELKPEDVFKFPGKLLEGLVKSATDFSKAVVDGTFAVGREIKKSAEDAFKK